MRWEVNLSRKQKLTVRWSWLIYHISRDGLRYLAPWRVLNRARRNHKYEKARKALGKHLGREATFGDMFAASLGTRVEDPRFQAAIQKSLEENT